MSKWLTEVQNYNSTAAFKNLFSVSLLSNTDSNLNKEYFNNIQYSAEKLSFGSHPGLELTYNEGIKLFSIEKANKLKSVTITFRENGRYKITTALQLWMDNIYDKENNFFKKYNPLGQITVTVENPYDTTKNNNGYIIVKDAILQDFSYPEFDWSSGDQQKVTANFSFKFADWIAPTWTFVGE